jgi:hypothetical protein
MAAFGVNPLAGVGNQCGEVFAKSIGEKQRGAVRCQHLGDLMDWVLGHGQGAIPDIHSQDELTHGVHRHPHPVRGSGQVLDRLGLGGLAVFDRTEQGEERIHLHLLDVQVVQEVMREGFEVIGWLNQPAQYRMRIDLEDAGDGAETETLGQSCNGPHQRVRINLLAVKQRAMGLEEVPLATETPQLTSVSAVWMAVGAAIAPADPAVVRAGGMGAEVACGIDIPAAASGEDHIGWRRVGY